MSLRTQWIMATFLVAAAIAICLPMTGWVPQLIFRNATPSMPHGFYVFSHRPPVARGEIIVVRDPEHFQGWWLMKRVAGVRGDLYCWDGERHRINGRAMPPPSPDALEMGVPVWKGCRIMGTGEVVAYGDSPDSFDARYTGPVPEARIEGAYRPVVVW